MDNILLKMGILVGLYLLAEFAYIKYKQHRSFSNVVRTKGRPISYKKED